MEVNNIHQFDEFFDKFKGEDRQINFLVFHHIEAKSLDLAISELKKHKVSAHYLIDENGEIFSLVDEKNIAYHAGLSFWRGFTSLNKNSIGIEFLTKDAKKIGFSKKQMKSGLDLAQNLKEKYQIDNQNIVAHSDIAYFEKGEKNKFFQDVSHFLNRKDDPSHLFDWQFLSKNDIGFYPKKPFFFCDKILFNYAQKSDKIKHIKRDLAQFGYKVNHINDIFDLEMKNLAIVFNRRFLGKENEGNWLKSSDFALNYLTQKLIQI